MNIRLTMPMSRLGLAEIDGRFVSLSPLQIRTVEILLLRQRLHTSLSDLLEMLYGFGDLEPEWGYHAIWRIVSAVNRKARGVLIRFDRVTGYTIDTT